MDTGEGCGRPQTSDYGAAAIPPPLLGNPRGRHGVQAELDSEVRVRVKAFNIFKRGLKPSEGLHPSRVNRHVCETVRKPRLRHGDQHKRRKWAYAYIPNRLPGCTLKDLFGGREKPVLAKVQTVSAEEERLMEMANFIEDESLTAG
ncbi:hypothetical protein FB451DRAFT_1182837 [Mycena latifolia]|nr:hypothetical protein FB451DRAFT_1182837 [Mycena latifolia]